MHTTEQILAFVATPPAMADTDASDATWQQELVLLGLSDGDTSTAPGTNGIAIIGPVVTAEMVGVYASLQDQGSYTSADIQSASAHIAANMRATVPHKTYTLADIKTDADTSYARMLTYRGDLRIALAPLLENSGSELEIYGKYIETSDSTYLAQLSSASQNYTRAAQQSAALTVPKDAINYHKDILNAMEQFAATLDQMVAHAADPLASMALLRTYNQSESDMYYSFKALSAYYSQKTP